MVQRAILDFINDHKYLASTGLLTVVFAVLFVLSSFYSIGSIAGTDSPRFGDCSFNRETGDIQGGCSVLDGRITAFDRKISGFSNGEKVPNYFWVRIDGIKVSGSGDVDEKSPQFWWLYKNGYTTSESREEIRQGDFPEQTGIRSLQWNPEIREQLEAGTVCSADIKLSSTGNVWVESTQESQRYEDQPDDTEPRPVKIVPEPVTVTADDLRITQNSMFCRFDFTEIMNQGMALDGQFVEWSSGSNPSIGGYHGSTSFSVDFGQDSDLDGIRDENDDCPDTAGIEAKNGCPNQPVVIEAVNGPRNITVGETVRYTVEASNPDQDNLSMSWSNGDSRDSATYSFNSTGERTIRVSVSDGLSTISESVMVNVEEKTIFDSVLGFFNDIWNVLWYSG